MNMLDNEKLALVANTVRCLSIDAIEAAKSGHPGLPMGLADVAAVLWLKYLKHDPKNPQWEDRDRLVLSGGHGSMLLYSMLHLSGYGLSLDDIRAFRQLSSKTPGHPERGVTPGVEISTGPLGQGVASAVGMALAERMLAARFGKSPSGFAPVDHNTIVLCGDGDLEEGISHEACSLAGHLKLGKLVMIFDSNGITIEGSTSVSESDDVAMRFKAYGWRVIKTDGHDFAAIDKALKKAFKSDGRPTVVIAKTVIGKGSPNKAGSSSCHGAPLGEGEVRLVKEALGFDPGKDFFVPEEVYPLFEARRRKLSRMSARWRRNFKAWRLSCPEESVAWDRHMSGTLPDNLEALMPEFPLGKAIATRTASGQVLNALAPVLPQLVGGSADLGPSNNTILKAYGDVFTSSYGGRNLHFGIRELAMSAVMNGIAAHGGFRVYGGTFMVFSDYCKPAIRMSALMGLPVVYVFSHDSFHVGEDGPTHQPVEQLVSLRSIPGLVTLRPADAAETAAAWLFALRNTSSPTALVLTRQNLGVIDRAGLAPASELGKGGYVLWQRDGAAKPDLVVIATGSEVSVSLEAAKSLPKYNIRIVSMPSRELFEAQSRQYRDAAIGEYGTKRLVVEAASSMGWEGYALPGGRIHSIDRFGTSAPAGELAKKFGFTPEKIAALMEETILRKEEENR